MKNVEVKFTHKEWSYFVREYGTRVPIESVFPYEYSHYLENSREHVVLMSQETSDAFEAEKTKLSLKYS